MHVGWCICVTGCVIKLDDNLQELIVSFHYMGSGDTAQSLGLLANAFTCYDISLVHNVNIS